MSAKYLTGLFLSLALGFTLPETRAQAAQSTSIDEAIHEGILKGSGQITRADKFQAEKEKAAIEKMLPDVIKALKKLENVKGSAFKFEETQFYGRPKYVGDFVQIPTNIMREKHSIVVDSGSYDLNGNKTVYGYRPRKDWKEEPKLDRVSLPVGKKLQDLGLSAYVDERLYISLSGGEISCSYKTYDEGLGFIEKRGNLAEVMEFVAQEAALSGLVAPFGSRADKAVHKGGQRLAAPIR